MRPAAHFGGGLAVEDFDSSGQAGRSVKLPFTLRNLWFGSLITQQGNSPALHTSRSMRPSVRRISSTAVLMLLSSVTSSCAVLMPFTPRSASASKLRTSTTTHTHRVLLRHGRPFTSRPCELQTTRSTMSTDLRSVAYTLKAVPPLLPFRVWSSSASALPIPVAQPVIKAISTAMET